MANVKLDFSKMRHVSTDEHTTTLKHPDGHEIRLSHKSLSPDNQKALAALAKMSSQAQTPLQANQASQQMAEGGRIKAAWGFGSNPVSDDPSSPKYDHSEAVGKYGVDAANTREIRSMHGQDLETGDPIVQTAPAPSALVNRMPASDTPAPQSNAKGGEISPMSMPTTVTGQAKGGIQSLSEPGHPGDTTCQACGGPIRKAYADPDQPVSQDDSAPQVPTNLDPDSAGVPASVPNYRDPQQATSEPISKEDPDRARTKEIYNRMMSNVIPKGMTAPIAIAQFGQDGQSPQQFNSNNWIKAQKQETDEKAVNAAAISQQQQDIIKENQARVSAGLAPLPVPDVPNGPQVPGTPENPPEPNAINPSGQPVDAIDQGTQNMLTMSNQGFMRQLLGIEGTGAAQSQFAQQQAKIYDTQAKAERNILNNYQDAYHSIDGEMNAVRDDIANNHITPEKYWTGDKDGNGSHSKIASAIGMIIAGFNPTNKPNAAIDFLKFNMEQNLKAQAAEMTKKQNVLTSLQNKFRNMNDTMNFARLTNAQMAYAQLQKAAANATGGPNGLAAMEALQKGGALLQQYAPLQQKIAMSQTMMHMAANSTGDPDLEVAQSNKMARYATALGDTAMAKQWQDATVPGVGVTRNLAPVPDAVKTQISTHKTVSDIMNQALEIAKQPIPTNPAEYAKYEARASTIQGQLIGMVKQAQHDGVYKPSEAEFLTSQIGGSPGSIFRDFSAIPKIEELQEVKQNEYNNLLHTYNLPTRQLPKATQQPQTKTVNGVTYRRGPNGEAIPVK